MSADNPSGHRVDPVVDPTPDPEGDPEVDPRHDRRNDPDDRTLVARMASGERAALEVLYRRHAGWLTARLQRRSTEVELVDTALQDTFLAAWRGAASFRGDGDVGAWLWGIAVRRLADGLRARRPAPMGEVARPDGRHVEATSPTTTTSGWPPGRQLGAAPSAEAAALGATVGGDLGDAIGRLEPDLQTVLLATAVDGLTTKEVARMLGIPQGTVKTRLMRARAQMQERLT